MNDERPEPDPIDPDQQPVAGATPPAADAGYTPGGYAYEVVGDAPAAAGVAEPAIVEPEAAPPAKSGGLRRVPWWTLPLAIIATAVVVGVAVWFIADGGDSGSNDAARVDGNVGSIINAFSQGQSQGALRRYDGALPPGFPDDLPVYENAEIVSSLVQIDGQDAVFLAVYDTTDSREDVDAYYAEALDSGDFQVEVAQEGRESSIYQFSRTDNADVSGLVLAAESADQEVTTIFYSIKVVGGADSVDLEPFTPRVSRAIPEGYPSEVPQYPDATIVETVTQRDSGSVSYGVAYITRDNSQSVLDFYRSEFDKLGWTVTDADVTSSSLEDAEGINFESSDGNTTGSIIVGVFGDDRNYTRIETQVRVTE